MLRWMATISLLAQFATCAPEGGTVPNEPVVPAHPKLKLEVKFRPTPRNWKKPIHIATEVSNKENLHITSTYSPWSQSFDIWRPPIFLSVRQEEAGHLECSIYVGGYLVDHKEIETAGVIRCVHSPNLNALGRYHG